MGKRSGTMGAAALALAASGIAAMAISVPGATATTIAPAARGTSTTLHGTFVTPLTQGNIRYVAQRAIYHGSEGMFRVAGKRRPGSVYGAIGGGTGMVWYYGYTGLMAGNALVTLQPDGTYSGPIWFFDKQGDTIDSGTVTVTFP